MARTISALASICRSVCRLVREHIPAGAGTPTEGTNCNDGPTCLEVTIRCVNLLSFITCDGSFTISHFQASNTSKFFSLPMDPGRLEIFVRLRPRNRRLRKPNTSAGRHLIELSCRFRTDYNLLLIASERSEMKLNELWKTSNERRCGAFCASRAISPVSVDTRRDSLMA